MKEQGFNTIRLPFSDELFAAGSTPNGIDFSKNPDLQGLTGLEIMDRIVAHADEIGIRIILDHHRSAAGNSANESGLWYSPEYPESVWIEHLTQLAARYALNPSVVGIDLHNEPHGPATWGDGTVNDWRLAAERAGNAVLAANPALLIIVEGVESAASGSYWWGGNLSSAGVAPVRLDVANRLVYSAHDYPASVYQQSYFNDSSYPENLPAIWNENWGYLFRDGIAPVLLGEFGSKLETASDQQWFDAMVEYLKGDLDGDGDSDLETDQEGISWTYWSWNPNSGDTGGILQDDWQTIHRNKVDTLTPVQSEFLEAAGNSTATLTVSLSAASNQTITVDYSTLDGTAVNGADYTATAGILEFLPGEVVKTFQVDIQSDSVMEADEEFLVKLSNAMNASLHHVHATVTIVDDDEAPGVPTITISNASVQEMDTGATALTFNLALSEVTAQDVSVDYTTIQGTAVSPDDYEAVSGTVTVPAGQSTQEITVHVAGDRLEEGDESFEMALSNAVNATLAVANATGTIIDNDQAQPAPGFSCQIIDDWGSGFNGEITLTNQGEVAWSDWRLEFEWDHEISQVWNGVLVEQSNASYTIENELWNNSVGPGQSVKIGFSGTPGNVTTIPSSVYVNGVAVDVGQAAPTISIADLSISEGDSGISVATFVVSLSRIYSDDVTVNYSTQGGSADPGSDYEEQQGRVTIPAGDLAGEIAVNIYGDLDVENDETLAVVLSIPKNATIARGVATGVVTNDDSNPGNRSAEYRTVSDWGSGFTGELTLTNRTDMAWEGWNVQFNWEHNLKQFWNAELVSRSSEHYVVKNESWNRRVEPGASVTFGFIGNPGKVTSTPHNILINGERVVGPEDPIDAPIKMSIDDVAIVEPASEREVLASMVKLSHAVPAGQTTAVDYSATDSTAVANDDFIPAHETLMLQIGEIEETIEILVNGDAVVAADTNFQLALSRVMNAELAVNKTASTIENKDLRASAGNVAWDVSSQWTTGYVASFAIMNDGRQPWTNWALEFDLPHEITSIWGADIVSHEGTRYRIRFLPWNGTVDPGDRVTIGYQVDADNVLEPLDLNILLS